MEIVRKAFNYTADIREITIYYDSNIITVPVKLDKEINKLVLQDLYPGEMQARITEYLKENGYNI
jgi:hypothetical protein